MKNYESQALKLKTAPTLEPVTLTELKNHCRIVDVESPGEQDSELTLLLQAAREQYEAMTGRKLLKQTWQWYLDDFPAWDYIELPHAPLISVGSLKYTDSAGVVHTLSSSEYIVDAVSPVGRIVLKEGGVWPTVNLLEANAIEITFDVGFGTAASAVPAMDKIGVRWLAAHFYENREPVAPIKLEEVPIGLQALVRLRRMWEFFL